MENWLRRTERRLDFLAVPGLALFLAAMNAAVGILSMIKPGFPGELALDPELLLQGQAWRGLTYIFIPPAGGSIWLVLWLLLYYGYLRMLENVWGDLRLTLFCLLGALSTTAVSLIFGEPLSSSVFNASLFLAFARIHPEFEVLLFFILPVKMKWLANLLWAMLAWNFLFGALTEKAWLAGGLAHYWLFFGSGHIQEIRGLLRRWRNRNRY
ncbi:MAG: hypothetical protein HY549_00925 [Elusimicrobia bacterium]|nr:hypothetical protein [Elusimicrobiota bacterium]